MTQVTLKAAELVSVRWPERANFETLVQQVRDLVDAGKTVTIDFTGYNRWSRSCLVLLHGMIREVVADYVQITAKHDTVKAIVILWEAMEMEVEH